MNGMTSVLKLINVVGAVDGRKKLQKIVHILKCMGHDFPQQFGYLHYGPYSSDLASQIDKVSKTGLVREEARVEGGYETYSYRADESLPQFLNDLGQGAEPAWTECAKSLAKKDARDLEAVSTILYLRQCGFQNELLQQRFAELKPQLVSRFPDALAESRQLVPLG